MSANPNPELFRRSWSVIVDNLDVSGLHIEFKILRSIKEVPNKCAITVWNLSEEHRAQLEKRNRPNGAGGKLSGIPVRVEAGFLDNRAVLFEGDLREVASQRDGTDWKTFIAGDDGGRAYREGRINQSFAAGTPLSVVFRQCASALGVGIGNVATFDTEAQIAGIGSALPHALVMSGAAARELTRLTTSMGLSWSIQSGALQILKKGTPLNQSAILLTPQNGLIGSPEASMDCSVSLGSPQQFAADAQARISRPKKPKDTSILRLRTLLIPGMVPGRKIVLKSQSFDGGYMLTETEAVGQSFGRDWNYNCIARVY